jgi:hypothetical protein
MSYPVSVPPAVPDVPPVAGSSLAKHQQSKQPLFYLASGTYPINASSVPRTSLVYYKHSGQQSRSAQCSSLDDSLETHQSVSFHHKIASDD